MGGVGGRGCGGAAGARWLVDLGGVLRGLPAGLTDSK